MSKGSLDGRVAWVTGGATGIGRCIAKALSGAGADVALGSLVPERLDDDSSYAHRPGELEVAQAVAEVTANGSRAWAVDLDVRNDASIDAFHESTTAALGPVDILVNAAGVSAQSLISEGDDATWAAVIDTNLNGPYRTTRRVLPGMIERGWGRIINIASTAARVGHPDAGAYCASKAGLVALTRCVALEGAPHGVTCNAISPGSVDTGMMRRGSELRVTLGQGDSVEDNIALITAAMPQRRLITAEEIAALALFLCGEEARGLTMEDITVSGGAAW